MGNLYESSPIEEKSPIPESDISDESRESTPNSITVLEAIDEAVESRLRQTLKSLCVASKEAEGLVKSMLLSNSGSNKRKAYEVCHQCDQEYHVDMNDKRSCVYHTGEKETYDDDGFWADDDENCQEIINGFIDDPDYQKGFMWNCCDQLGSVKGCKIGKHRPVAPAPTTKKRKLSEPGSPDIRTWVKPNYLSSEMSEIVAVVDDVPDKGMQ